MSYPLRHKSRHSMIAAGLLLTAGALAAAAAHVGRVDQHRGDVELIEPASPVVKATTPDSLKPVAPLFDARRGARGVESALPDVSASQNLLASVSEERLNAPAEYRGSGGGRYQDYAGARSQRRAASGSGGARTFGSGGAMAGAGAWGGVSGTARTSTRTETIVKTVIKEVKVKEKSSSSNSGGNNSSANAAGAGESSAATPPGLVAVGGLPSVAAAPGVGGLPSAVGTGGQGGAPSPAGTPEPLTFLLVGAGLAGLYGARKHVA